MPRRRPSFAAPVIATVVAVLLSGCGDGEEATSSPATSSPAASSAAAGQVQETPGAPADAPASPPTGPATGASLEAYAAEGQQAIEATLDSFDGAYSEIRVEAVEPNGIEYVYVFSEARDAAEAAEAFETSVPVLQDAFDTRIAPDMEARGFVPPSATWTYLNPDGSLIWSRTIS